MTRNYSNQTAAIRAGLETDEQFGAVIPPLYLSSNYTFEGLGQPRKYDYTRSGNPTRDNLATALAELEQGAAGIITSSGISAIHLALQVLNPGDHLIAPHDCYGGTYRLFTKLAERGLFEIDYVDQNDESALKSALKSNTKLIWVETPSNPLLRVYDIKNICALAKQKQALVAVDNTFLSPVHQQPLKLGADIVVHSTTKYINGHSDVVGGAVITKSKELGEELAWWANCLGITGAPFDSYLTLRGLRTLHVRQQQHEQTAKKVVAFLLGHSAVDRVYHPSLPTHPNHHIAVEQQSGFGAVLSFELGLTQPQIAAFFSHLELFSLAESLGGVESLICHPATMTHAAMDDAARLKAGIRNNLIRVSIGLEQTEELIADLRNALDKAKQWVEPQSASHSEINEVSHAI
ncbi:cystathionine gamma-synthase [Psychrosphaera ytuae]|uniref:Cystathionine gamma-synthase n=1 Tax=Psychrosphaera ytuae TaxID=2820710 RepID=A0A975DC95_9GAMM|nr:cystathionine gamma-synthase [Psychrosphaera ytuae]QTH64502.1 cystathionine gamma-synthase [Psychrosphaera ytuae]